VTKSMQLNYEFDRQLELERADAIEEGLEQGIKQGLEQGLEQGIELINQLNQILLSEGKYDELQKASKDKEYQKKLLAEYGLLNEKQGE
jgi:flagellar biosynthesis/type III secretory pathway protein FliH